MGPNRFPYCLGKPEICNLYPSWHHGRPNDKTCWMASYRWHLLGLFDPQKPVVMLRIMVDGVLGEGQKIEALMAEELGIPVIQVDVETSPHALSRDGAIALILSVMIVILAGYYNDALFGFSWNEGILSHNAMWMLSQIQCLAPILFVWHPSLACGCRILSCCLKSICIGLIWVSSFLMAYEFSLMRDVDVSLQVLLNFGPIVGFV